MGKRSKRHSGLLSGLFGGRKREKPRSLKSRSLQFEPLMPREMLAGDVVLTAFFGDGSHLVVNYEVVGKQAEPFRIGIYRGGGEEEASRALVAQLWVTDAANLQPGRGYSLAVQPAFRDWAGDYMLVARVEVDSKAEFGASGGRVLRAEERIFAGGIFLAADGTLHVHGTPGDDQVAVTVADHGGLRVRVNDLWQEYKPEEVSAVHIRTHEGDDVVAVSALVRLPVWVFGGAGSDYVLGGSGNDLLVGGPGDDRLYGGAGSDVLAGGEGNDYLHGGEGQDGIDGGSGENVLVAAEGETVFWGASGVEALGGRWAVGLGATAAEEGWAGMGQPSRGERCGLVWQSDTAGGGRSSGRLVWVDDSLLGPSGGGVAVDHQQGGVPLKRDVPVAAANLAAAGTHGVGLARDHVGGGPVLKQETPSEDRISPTVAGRGVAVAGGQGRAGGRSAGGGDLGGGSLTESSWL